MSFSRTTVRGSCRHETFPVSAPARTSLHSFRSGPGFSNTVDVCTQISDVALFDASSPNTLRCRVQRVLVNQRHNFRTQRPARFLREEKPNNPNTAGPT